MSPPHPNPQPPSSSPHEEHLDRQILALLALAGRPMTVTEIARELGISNSPRVRKLAFRLAAAGAITMGHEVRAHPVLNPAGERGTRKAHTTVYTLAKARGRKT